MAEKSGRGEDRMSAQYSLFFIQRFKGKVLFNVMMSEYTSLRIGGPADVMAFPQDEGDLKDLITFAVARDFPFHVIGGGTNLLVRDGGIRGIVINMCEGFRDMTWHDDRAVIGAGVRLSEILAHCKDAGLSGLEFAAGIPGTLGGAVAMNAGAYGSEMKDVVEGVEVVSRKGQKLFLPKSEIRFSYRKAELPASCAVIRAHMRFAKKSAEEVKARTAELRERRRSTSAISLPNAGSIFKNPEGMFAGKLIEDAGLKGARSGGAEVSGAHANCIVNSGGAHARDVLNLMALIRDRVYSRGGVLLEPEIKVVGDD